MERRESSRASALFIAALAVLGAVGARAETLIARDTANPYQKNPHHKVRHVAIRNDNQIYVTGQKALFQSMRRLSRRYGFRLDSLGMSNEAPALNDNALEGVDVLVLFDAYGGKDSLALERYVYRRGGALLMVLETAAFKSCPGVGFSGGGDSLSHPRCSFLARAAGRQYYHKLSPGNPAEVYVDSVRAGEVPPHRTLGAPDGVGPVPPASANAHGIANPETRNIFAGLPRVWTDVGAPWFSFSSSPRRVGEMTRKVRSLDSASYVEGAVNVLLSLDETSHQLPSEQRMGDHPVSWTRKMGNGLSAFTNMGTDNVYAPADSVAERYHWGLLRYLARDFAGCLNPASPHYNPEASVERLTPSDTTYPNCAAPAGLGTAPDGRARLAVTARDGLLRVRLPDARRYEVLVSDVSGRRVFEGRAQGALEIAGQAPGLYFVEARDPDGATARARIRLL